MSDVDNDAVLAALMKARELDRVTVLTPPIRVDEREAFEEAESGHVHLFELICRSDRYGTMVFECNCGARRRKKKTASGLEDVHLDIPPHPLGDCLFEKTSRIVPSDYPAIVTPVPDVIFVNGYPSV